MLAVVVSALALTAPAVPAASPTVGDFVMTIARASRLPAADPGSAASALRSRGVVLPSLPPSKSLTEGDVVAIGRSLGLDLRTSRPEASFGEPEVTRFLRAFGGALRGNGDDPPGVRSDNDPPGPYPRPEGAADPLSKGKGKKKGLDVSPSEPV